MTLHSPEIENALRINRRHFFGRQAKGLGTAALASLLDRQGLLAQQAQPPQALEWVWKDSPITRQKPSE